jgi:hypothetical protein
MFTVPSQPFRRQRHAVTAEIPASLQNLCRLMMGLPSDLTVDVMFMELPRWAENVSRQKPEQPVPTAV